MLAFAAPARCGPATSTAPAVADARYAQTVFNSLYGEACRKVTATPGASDDAELAGEIVKGAPNAAGEPAVLAVLCRKACELGSKALSGYPAAIEAMRLLGENQPQTEPECWQKILALLQRKYARTTKFDRLEAGEHLLVCLINRAEKMARAGNYDEALLMVRKALPAGRTMRWPQYARLLAMQKYLIGRRRFAVQAGQMESRLKLQPKDQQARPTLIRLRVLELDDPAKAAAAIGPDSDEVTRTYVPLAAKPMEELDPNVCVELGKWYVAQTKKASPDARPLLWARAAGYLRHTIRRSPQGHVNRLRAKVALQGIEEHLKAAAGRYPLEKLTSPLRPDLLARGRARNRLPVNYQLQVIHRDLKTTHGGAKIKARFTPDASDKNIVSASISDRNLARLDALAALPLTSLSLTECQKLKGDLSALAGIPLRSLALQDCAGLRSLHGLEGMPLRRLNILGCVNLSNVEALKGLALDSLAVSSSPAIRDLRIFRAMSLKSLTISGFRGLKDLSAVTETQLASLSVEDCSIETLHGVEDLELSSLTVSKCPGIRSLAALKGKTPATSLDLTGCRKLESLEDLDGLPLKRLSLAGCSGLTGDLSALAASKLSQLDLSGCAKLTSLKGLEGKLIESLSLAGCRSLTGDLSALKGTIVTSLDLTDCNSLQGLAGIQELPVADLVLAGCTGLGDDLSPLKGVKLTSLDISNCSNFTSLSGLEGAPLRALVAAGCRNLTGDLTALSGSKLTDLDLSGCGNLTSLRGIEDLPLRNLDLCGCTRLKAEDFELLEQNTTLVTFRPPAKGLGKAITNAVNARRAKARAAKDKRRKTRR